MANRVSRLLLAITGDSTDAQQAVRDAARRVRDFSRQRGSATIDVDNQPAKRGISEVEDRLRRVGGASPSARVEVQISQAMAEIDRVNDRLTMLGQREPSPKVTAQTARASADLDRLMVKLAKLAATDVTIDVNVRRDALATLTALGYTAHTTHRRVSRLSLALRGLASAAGEMGSSMGSSVRIAAGPLGAKLTPLTGMVVGLASVIAGAFVAALTAMTASLLAAVGGLISLTTALAATAAPVGVMAIATVTRFGKVLDVVKAKENAADAARQKHLESTRGLTAQAAAAQVALEKLTASERNLLSVLEQVRKEMGGALKPATDAVFNGMAAALKMLPGLVSSLRDEFLDLGTSIGAVFESLAREMTNAPWTAALEELTSASSRLTRVFGVGIFIPVLRILREIALAALPALESGLRSVASSLGKMTTPEGLKKIGPIVEALIDHFKSWMDLFGAIIRVAVALGVAIAPIGKGLVERLTDITNKAADFINTAEGTRKVQEIFTRLSELAGYVAGGIAKIVGGFFELSANAAPSIQALLGHIKAFGGAVIEILGPLASKLQDTFVGIIDAIRPALPFFQNIVLPLLSGVFQGVLMAVQPLIAIIKVLAEVLGWIGEKAEFARPFIEGFGKVLGFIFSGPILGAVGGVLRGVGMGFGLMGRLAQGAGKILSWIGGLIGKLLSGPFNALKRIGGTIGGAFTKLAGVAKSVWGSIKRFIGDAVSGAKNIAIGAFNALKSRVSAIFNGIKGAASSVWGAIKRFVGDAASGAKNIVIGAFNALKDGAVRAFNGVKDGAARVFGRLKSFIYDKVAAVGRAVRGLVTGFLNVGKALIEGLINGVKAMARRVVDAVKSVVNGAKKAAKRLLGIGSPSKVFAGFGKDVGQGFANGITAMRSTVGKAIDRTMTGQVDAIGANLTAGLAGGLSIPGIHAPASAGATGTSMSTREGDEYHFHVQGVPGTASDDGALLTALETKLRARGGLPSLP